MLYYLDNFENVPDFLSKLIFFLKKYKPEHSYLYHNLYNNLYKPAPEFIRKCHFDAVIFDVTVLCLRYLNTYGIYEKKVYEKFVKNYSFLKYCSCVKIAFPQDDYDCSKILDNWLINWGVDVVFSPLADNPDISKIYENYIKFGRIELGYTGYIDDDYFKLKEKVKPFKEREIDIFYRTKKLLPYFGWIGELKWKIADIVKEKAKEYGLKVDISYRYEDSIFKDKWFDFLGNSKFVLGSLSGSSLIDPYGEIQKKVRKYCKLNPNYNYFEVEKNFFPNQDIYYFTAISPRNIEAAFTLTGQILVKGYYSGILKPWEDYIPLEPDASNFYEVYNAMTDFDYSQRIIKKCYEKIASTKDLYYENLANRVINLIYEIKEKKGVTKDKDYFIYNFNTYLNKYSKFNVKGKWIALLRIKFRSLLRKIKVFLRKYKIVK